MSVKNIALIAVGGYCGFVIGIFALAGFQRSTKKSPDQVADKTRQATINEFRQNATPITKETTILEFTNNSDTLKKTQIDTVAYQISAEKLKM